MSTANCLSDTNKVIHLDRFRPKFSYAPIAQIEAYWSDLCRGGSVPKRSDVDPRALENVLDHAFILERIAPGVARVRIAGGILCDMMGMEVRGMTLNAVIEDTSGDAFAQTLEHMFSNGAAVQLVLSGGAQAGQPRLDLKIALFPLRDDFGNINRALGGIVMDGAIGDTPRRLVISSNTVQTPAVEPVTEEMTGFAEEQTAFETAVPYLRLVK